MGEGQSHGHQDVVSRSVTAGPDQSIAPVVMQRGERGVTGDGQAVRIIELPTELLLQPLGRRVRARVRPANLRRRQL